VDTQTRHALKHDRFVDSTTSALDWVQENRGLVIRYSVVALVVVAIVAAALVTYNIRNQHAVAALNKALNVYTAPLTQPGEPANLQQGSYPTAAARARAAHPLFEKAADNYGWLHAGQDARYFAGLTDLQMNDNSAAEKELKQAADARDKNVAALAKMALASLYIQTGRGAQAVELYNKLAAHPTATVPASSAQIALAQYYENSNPDKARQLLAKVQDQNKDNFAGQIAQRELAKLQ
jgi:predicted negative regulator of RcsB-dependent stress response